MNTTQVSTILNGVVEQALGSEVLASYSAQGIVSLGDAVLSSTENTEAFLDTLVQRIGRTIISFRSYRNKLGDMVMDSFEFGAILQKVKVQMPEASDDEAWDLEDGQALDHYIVSKPKAKQKLFVTRAPYKFFITIQEWTLKEAFLSETAMGSFISSIFGEVQNKMELTMETLGRITLSNYIALVSGTAQEVKLVSEYNAGADASEQVTSVTALRNEAFLRFAIGRIKQTMRMLTEMSQIFNSEKYDRHTPYEYQRLKVLSSFESALETQVEYAAFNENYVKLTGFSDIAFFQSINDPDKITIVPSSSTTGDTVTVDNIVAVLYDRDALGTYRQEEKVATTPLNARGLYYNTFWHEKQLWFNDLSENFVLFTLN